MNHRHASPILIVPFVLEQDEKAMTIDGYPARASVI